MQTHGGDAAEDAILARERSFTPRVLIDWDRNGSYGHELSDMTPYVLEAETNRKMNRSSPSELRLIEGSSAAELRLSLSGTYNGESIVTLFSPYNVRSPFYGRDDLTGCEVVYEIDVETDEGPATYPQGIFYTQTPEPDRSTGEVALTALDRAQLLRSPVRMPRWAVSQHWEDRGRLRAQLCDGQWMIDHALRSCGVSPTGQTPTPDLQVEDMVSDGLEQYYNRARFFLAGTGSIAPYEGWVDNFTAQQFPDTEGGAGEMYVVDGVQEPALSDDPAARYPICYAENSSDYQNTFWMGGIEDIKRLDGTYRISLQIPTRSGTHNSTNGAPVIRVRLFYREIELYISDGQAFGRWFNDDSDTTFTSTKHDMPTGQDSVHVWMLVEFTDTNGLRVCIGFDDTSTGWEQWYSGGPPDSAPPDDPFQGFITVNRVVRFNDLAFQIDPFLANPYQDVDVLVQSSRSTAALDPSQNRLTHIPRDRDGDDAWNIIKDVAAAEFGSAFWDEQGIFRFWNRDRIASKQGDIVRTVTPDEWSSLSLVTSSDNVRNVLSVEIKRVRGVNGIAYESNDPDFVYATNGEIKQLAVESDSIVYPRPYTLVQHSTIEGNSAGLPIWSDAVAHGYVPQWNEGGWQEFGNRTLDTDNFVFLDREGRINFFATNNIGSGPMRFAMDPTSSNGQPRGALRIMGSMLEDTGTYVRTVRNKDSIRSRGERNLKLSGDFYHDAFQAESLMSDLLERLDAPIPSSQNITIPGDPRLQLADAIDVEDPNGFGTIPAQIHEITSTMRAGQAFTTELGVEFVRPSGWRLDSPKYSVLGETTKLS